jgi:glycerate-2-kinase
VVPPARHYDVIAAGKGAVGMLAGVADLPIRRVVRAGPTDASHPLPDDRSVGLGARALGIAREAAADDVLLVLISGGASSLLAGPADGITLADKRATVQQLLMAGAPIGELNAVRKHLSAIKGGQLAAATRARMCALLISDVVGDDPSVIASGPTVADPSTFADALAVLERRGGAAAYPAGVSERLRRGAAGAVAETPKPGDAVFDRTMTRVIGGLRNAMAAAGEAATALGYRVVIVDAPIVGDARGAARDVAAHVGAARRGGTPLCVISGGETTVTVRGTGRGGRNQELALALAPHLNAFGGDVAAICAGTDGVDGPTDAAGAYVDATTLNRAAAAGLDAERFLNNNDSYGFFDRLGNLIRTGPTGTNVGDIQIVVGRW